jgi:hypothetical protein
VHIDCDLLDTLTLPLWRRRPRQGPAMGKK